MEFEFEESFNKTIIRHKVLTELEALGRTNCRRPDTVERQQFDRNSNRQQTWSRSFTLSSAASSFPGLGGEGGREGGRAGGVGVGRG